MKSFVYLLVLLPSLTSVAQRTSPLSLQSPPDKLTLLAPNFISTVLNERDFAIAPDGKEIFFTISTPRSTFQTLVYCKQSKNGTWSAPEIASFAGHYSDLEPTYSTDGKTLYFASNRPLEGDKAKDFDLWKVQRDGQGWGQPENLGSTVNTTGDEFYPSITKSGSIYFTATYKDGPGREDIYKATYVNGVYEKPIALDSAINTKFYEFNAFVSPDEQYILFTSYGRKDDSGGGDLYVSTKDSAGKWQKAVNVKQLNSKQLDYCPYVSPDGTALFITSERHTLSDAYVETKATYNSIVTNPLNGTGNIYWIDFKKLINSLEETK